MRHLPERAQPEPTDLSLQARQARARQLSHYDGQVVEVMNTDAQHVEDVAQHLGLARQALQVEARRYWPEQEWKSTSEGGPPREGDLHVKVASTIGDDGRSVLLRVGLSAIEVDHETEEDVTRHGTEAAIFVPLTVAQRLIECLEEQVAYWEANPPPPADEAVTERPDR